MPNPTLRASAVAFSTKPRVGDATGGHTGARVKRVVGLIDTTITLLEYNGQRLCIFASHFGTAVDDATVNLQNALSDTLQLSVERILIFSSHNHSVPQLEPRQRTGYEESPKPAGLTAFGRAFVQQVRAAAKKLPAKLEPVSVWYGEGHESRITYNRKGRRADGSTYLMREEDRALLGGDFAGDIDAQAPVVVLKRADGSPVTAIVQFNGHPVTMYHPEKLVASGDWPQVACRILAKKLRGLPVSFLQGCAGDVNSKHMFSADVKLANRYGSWLGATYVAVLRDLRRSVQAGYEFAAPRVAVPLGGVPAAATLEREIAEIRGFIKRAKANDQATQTCVGLNFPRAMSPAYRGKLVEYILPWSQWALQVRQRRPPAKLPRALPMNVYVLRLGDVAIVGLPTEPFMGIGRQVRAGSPFALTIPCGYVNLATGFVGYLPDSPNVGDREYMSAFHRYTRFLPPFRRPAGDVLARTAVATLKGFNLGKAAHDRCG